MTNKSNITPSSKKDKKLPKNIVNSSAKAQAPAATKVAPTLSKTRIVPQYTNKTQTKPLANKNNTQAKTVIKKQNALNTNKQGTQQKNEAALTKISSVIRTQDTKHGFSNAQKIVNQALKDKKIILNKRFVLEYMLGAGGMGAVYQARDLRKVEADDLNSEIAVKVLNKDFENHPDAFIALQREASRSHQLSHPNIVTVHDFDRDGNVIYMTMELLEGKDLDAYMPNDNKGMSVEKALPIISDYCQALMHAHKKHIIHSDLKPGNIFIGKDSTKVLDFGIARVTSQSSIIDSFDAGSLGALTPSYASLEMINGANDPHPSDDVYAAAIIAYELFSGSHPYNRKPANIALEENLKPKRISKLSKRQWKALESALKLKRNERTASISELFFNLTEKKTFPLLKIISILSLCIIAWLSYQKFISPDPLQEKIKDTYNKAEECFSNHNLACVVEMAGATLKLSPNNTQALTLLNTAQEQLSLQNISTLVKELEQCIDINKDIICAKSTLASLENLPNSEEAVNTGKNIISSFERNQKIKIELEESSSCFQALDFSCAIQHANEVLTIDTSNTQALSLLSNSKARQLDIENNEKNYQQAISLAESCLLSKNYTCAINSSTQALSFKPNDTAADAVKTSALYANLQEKEKIKNVNAIVQRGQDCFDSAKYDCAISSAESALRLSPDHAPALKLKNLGIERNNELKSKIKFQPQQQ